MFTNQEMFVNIFKNSHAMMTLTGKDIQKAVAIKMETAYQ